MILPAKHIKLSESLIGVGAFILKNVTKEKTIDDIWRNIQDEENINCTYNSFILALEYLYIIKAIDVNGRGELYLCD